MVDIHEKVVSEQLEIRPTVWISDEAIMNALHGELDMIFDLWDQVSMYVKIVAVRFSYLL